MNFATCPVQDCNWYGHHLTQKRATNALIAHCKEKHNLPEKLVMRFWRYWINDKRAYAGWSRTLDEIDDLLGYRRRDSGMATESQKLMKAYLGIEVRATKHSTGNVGGEK